MEVPTTGRVEKRAFFATSTSAGLSRTRQLVAFRGRLWMLKALGSGRRLDLLAVEQCAGSTRSVVDWELTTTVVYFTRC